ncbi:MAG: PQQ-dependent sugar dehydrogenase [Calditrichaeota bacterium]|nr:PQQ-dependent sugar dehydrogenase [Calditrichota bacterium]MCB9369631.1 PQQ-dependent sugar dehydrogenase [Calditrichota bacterium]
MGFRTCFVIVLVFIVVTQTQALTRQLITGGLDFPTSVAFAPGDDSRAYVTTQWQGKVFLVDHGMLQAEPFLDVQSQILQNTVEGGLLCITFDPDFVENRRFYVSFVSVDTNVVVKQYLVSSENPNFADPNSGEIVFEAEHKGRQHFAGNIAFGPLDGYLYIAVGDGGIPPSWQAAQNPLSFKGKIHRIDVSGDSGYVVPDDNPFVGDTTHLPEIYAMGFRNPWRFGLDRETGDVFIGDVGQWTYEEVDYISSESGGGQNFGWHIWEGTSCYQEPCTTNGLTFPIYEYEQNVNFGSAITGGFVYRGCAIPELEGRYVFADYVNAFIHSFRYDQGVVSDFWDLTPMLDTQDEDSIWFISSFGQDNHGELYFLDYVHQSWSSRLYKIVPDDNADCNDNFVNDGCDIREGTSKDENHDNIPDECQTPADDHPGIPDGIALLPCYPNPFNPVTTIEFVLPRAMDVRVSVYDISGRLVSELADGQYTAGTHRVTFNAEQLASGVYFAVLRSGDISLRQKMMLLK